MEGQAEDGGGANAADAGVAAGWREAYYGLLVAEKLYAAAPAALAWPPADAPGPGPGSGAGAAGAPRLWAAVPALLLHRHAWVRRAAARLLGAGFADGAVAPGLLRCAGAGRLALACFRQVEAADAEDALLTQARPPPQLQRRGG